jgi:hypothetical protein
LGVLWIHGDGLEVIADALFGSSELSRDVSAVIERLWRILVSNHVEHLERLIETLGLRKSEGVICHGLVRQNFTSDLDASTGSLAINLPPRAGHHVEGASIAVAPTLPAGICIASATAVTSTTGVAAATSRVPALACSHGRCENACGTDR